MIPKKTEFGFTLIELLVVISVIGLLASVILVTTKGLRSKARDARRVADIHQLYTALQLYYATYSTVPNCYDAGYTGGCDYVEPTLGGVSDSSLDGIFLPFLTGYIASTVKDPLNTGHYIYYFGTNVRIPPVGGDTYKFAVAALLENDGLKYGGFALSYPGYEYTYILAEH